MLASRDLRTRFKKVIGQLVMNTRSERVGRVVTPPSIGRQPLLQRGERVRTGLVDRTLKDGADLRHWQQVRATEEGQNARNELFASESVGYVTVIVAPRWTFIARFAAGSALMLAGFLVYMYVESRATAPARLA